MKLRINGFELGYEVLHGAGPALLLIHGFGLDRSIWRGVAKRHLNGYQVILPDVRGHGESATLKEPTRMAGLAEDMLRLLDVLQVERAVVGGHSMGGYITLALADQHPDRLAGVGLVTSRAAADSIEKRERRYQTIREIEARGASVVAETLSPRLSHDPSIQQQAYDIIARTQPAGLIGALQAMAERPDWIDFLPTIQVPALVVAGGKDQIVPLKEAAQMVELLPEVTYLEIPEAGHMPMLEAPDALGQGLRSFMETCFQS